MIEQNVLMDAPLASLSPHGKPYAPVVSFPDLPAGSDALLGVFSSSLSVCYLPFRFLGEDQSSWSFVVCCERDEQGNVVLSYYCDEQTRRPVVFARWGDACRYCDLLMAMVDREQEKASPVVAEEEMHPLKKARLQLGYTQKMLADFAQVGEMTIQRAEGGKLLRPDSAQRICAYFGEQYQRQVLPHELGLLCG
jgi:DNA-binding XRE family transcriptional regulator